jgi:DNA-binding winged helix-turn-helix (wHTH) protein
MTRQIAPCVYRFGRFELQPSERRLLVSGKAARVNNRAFDVLVTLVERAGQLVTKDELLERVWAKQVVEENNIEVQITKLRKLLGSEAIENERRHGYRFTIALDAITTNVSAQVIAVDERVFISYAKEDTKYAERLYRDLKVAGANPWMDTKNLKPGQRWQAEIEEEISNCTHFIALLSSRSVSKRGYVQSEIRRALEVWERLPERTLFLIPARLDECAPSHRSLNDFHRVDLFPRWKSGMTKILRALGLHDA